MVISDLTKNKSTKRVIIDILSLEWPLSLNKIYSRLRGRYGAGITYQATHKAVKELTQEKILQKEKREYQLSIYWINNIENFGKKLKEDYLKKDQMSCIEVDCSSSIEKDILANQIVIDFKRKGSIIHRTLSSLYKSGYDEIKVIFENHSELDIIQKTINQELIGFEIIEQGKEYIIVKQVSNISHSEFEAMLRRTFIFLLSNADECLEALKINDFTILKNLIIRDITVNKLTDYCRRSLNKKEGHFKHNGPGYVIIELLEKIGDGYRDLCKYVSKNEIKINKLIIELLSEINSLLRDVYKLFYSFNLNDIEKFLTKKEYIDKKIINLTLALTRGEAPVISYLNIIENNIFYLNGPLMIIAL